MEQPLGRTVGNALEVAEAIACLRGEGPKDVMDVTYALGSQMLVLGEAAENERDARRQLEQAVASGAATAKFRAIIEAQGGDASVLDNPLQLPGAKHIQRVEATRAGIVRDVDPMNVALAALRLGAGRIKAEDTVDPAVGIAELVKVGERVEAGATLCVIHANDAALLAKARTMLADAIVLGSEPVTPPELVGEWVS
jgi:pyrimidine-nucleoside phosphorylase